MLVPAGRDGPGGTNEGTENETGLLTSVQNVVYLKTGSLVRKAFNRIYRAWGHSSVT